MTDSASSAPPRHARRHALIWTLKILVSGGLLYWLFSTVDAREVWQLVRTASGVWLAAALALYGAMVLLSAWRWDLLLSAQGVDLPFGSLFSSFLVATFFNNFLPSNIGGDVVRIRDTARAAGSKTLATTIILLDRGLGLLGLVFVSACGATIAAARSEALGPLGPGLLWLAFAGGLAATVVAVVAPRTISMALRPLEVVHQAWVSERVERLTAALSRFRAAPRALVQCFVGAIGVQALIVAFYAAIARALGIAIPSAHLAILVPISFIVQMLPVSVNGFGVREKTFVEYFAALHLPTAGALALSLTGAAMMMVFSVSGAVAYVTRPHASEVGSS
ncbi:MAG: flippase-like domain-containing protein [Acidobacteria bacterium]|nr:flippase-like domain-containing protein [Acidobacteriota bacterium]